MGFGKFRITPELLRQVLSLPQDAEIKFIATDYDVRRYTEFVITVKHPKLPDIVPPVECHPTFRKEYGTSGDNSIVIFEGWDPDVSPHQTAGGPSGTRQGESQAEGGRQSGDDGTGRS